MQSEPKIMFVKDLFYEINYHDEFLEEQKTMCLELLARYLQSSFNETSCPPDFDGNYCWPSTPPDTIADIPCPLYLRSNKSMTRWCSSDTTELENFDNPVNKWAKAHYPDCSLINRRSGDIAYIFVLALNRNRNYSLFKDDEQFNFNFLDQTGSIISILSLSISLLIFATFSQLQDTRVKIHINMFISILLHCLVSLAKSFFYRFRINAILLNNEISYPQKPSHCCRLLMTISLSSEISIFTWLMIESWHFFSFISLSPYRVQHVKRLVYFGWGFPFLVILPWIIVQMNSADANFCWVGMDMKLGILAVPVVTIVLVNFCFFLLNVRIIFIKMRNIYMPRKQVYYWRWIKSSLMLVPLFGSYDILYVLWPLITDQKTKMTSLFIVRSLYSFQGFIVSVLYCFTNGQVQLVIERAWKNWKLKREINSKRVVCQQQRRLSKSESTETLSSDTGKIPDVHLHL